MSEKKTLGQIAFEAQLRETMLPWDRIAPFAKERWEHIAQAVASACGSEWISIKDGLPEIGKWVYVCKCGEIAMTEARLDESGQFRASHNALLLPSVTHWISKPVIPPLPPAP